MTKIDELRKEYREKVGSTYNMKYEWYANWLETQLLIEREQVKKFELSGVGVQSEQLICGECHKYKTMQGMG